MLAFAAVVLTCAGPPPAKPVTAPAGPLGAAVEAVRTQSGLAVTVAGVNPAAPCPAVTGTPWAVLDKLAAATNARVRLTHLGRAVELVAAAPGAPPAVASSDGPFRVAVQQVVGRTDFDTGRTTTEVTLLLHWEPRLPVFRLSGEPTWTHVTDDRGDRPQSPPASARVAPTGCQFVTTVRLAGVPRAATKLTRLTGTFTATAAAEMLTFRVADLGAKPAAEARGGVTVAAGRPVRVGDRYDLTVDLKYPPTPVEFESFEAGAWLADNRLTLTSPTGRTYTPTSDDFRPAGAGTTAVYRFPAATPGLDTLAGWSLTYTTPGPLAEYNVSFDLRDIPLP